MKQSYKEFAIFNKTGNRVGPWKSEEEKPTLDSLVEKHPEEKWQVRSRTIYFDPDDSEQTAADDHLDYLSSRW